MGGEGAGDGGRRLGDIGLVFGGRLATDLVCTGVGTSMFRRKSYWGRRRRRRREYFKRGVEDDPERRGIFNKDKGACSVVLSGRADPV